MGVDEDEQGSLVYLHRFVQENCGMINMHYFDSHL